PSCSVVPTLCICVSSSERETDGRPRPILAPAAARWEPRACLVKWFVPRSGRPGNRPGARNRAIINRKSEIRSSSRDNLHDLQPVAGVELALRKFRRRDRLAVVLHHHAARQQTLRNQKFLEGAGERGRHWPAVGGDRPV